MASFNWGKCYETGQPMVDQQHHVLVDLINHYGELLTAGGGVTGEDMEAVLQELAAYAHYHFDEEEKLMRQVGLDARHVKPHRRFHADFLQEVRLMRTDLEKGQTKTEQLLKFLTYWLSHHILRTDQSMARQMSAMAAGKSPQEAYVSDKEKVDSATEPLLAALNGLFQQITERNHELRQLNSTLEAKVEERTRSLSQANAMLEQLAMTDMLTGLPNRRLLSDRLQQALATCKRSGGYGALMFLDLDNFKPLNDTQGHDVGDLLLMEVARRLKACVRQIDSVARIGGDEFVVLLSELDSDKTRSDAQAGLVAEKIRSSLAEPYVLRVKRAGNADATVEHRCTTSIGVMVFSSQEQSQEETIKGADTAMYRAKQAGRNRVQFA
jgi:hemerythrin